MTVATISNKVTYNGDGVTTIWGYTFPVALNTDLQIYITNSSGVATLKVLSTDYTVDITNKQVTYPVSGSPLAVGSKITILRSVDLLQTVDWKRQGAFDSEVAEGAIDKCTEQAQQLTEALARSIKLPQSETGSDANTRLPTVANRASMFLAFDASGNPIASTGISSVPVSAFMTTVLDDLSAQAAMTTLGMYPNVVGIDHLAGSSGQAGTFQAFPPTAVKGRFIIQPADNTGNTNTTLTNAAFGQATTLTIPDPGASAAKVILSKAATFEANVAMAGFVLTGLGAGSANGQSIRYEQNFIRQAPVAASTQTVASTSSTTYQDTSLTATITPSSASSRVLVIVTGTLASNGSTNGAQVAATLADGSGNNLCGSTGFCTTDLSTTAGSYVGNVGAAAVLVHSPATTSAFTYKVQIKKITGTTTATWGSANMTQLILLVEII